MSIAVKILKPRALAAFTLAMLLALTTSGLTFTQTHGFTKAMTSSLAGATPRTVILQEGAKTCHTSMIPLTLAASLDQLPGVEAHPMTLTPTTTKGRTLTVRGVQNLSIYRDKILEGNLPVHGGSWALLGEEAADRLSLEVGDLWTVASPVRTCILTLQVAAIYRTGTLRDSEAVVPLEAGAALRGLHPEMVSFIEVQGMERNHIEALMKNVYNLTIRHNLTTGKINVLDSQRTIVSSFPTNQAEAKTLQLPFGHYCIAYSRSHYTSTLTEVLLTHNQEIQLNWTNPGTFTLKVQASASSLVLLHVGDKTVLEGDWQQDGWLFEAPMGLHLLELNETSHEILLMGDTTFHPDAKSVQHPVQFTLLWRDGREAGDYLLTVKNRQDELVATSRSPSSTTIVALPSGSYQAEISKPPYLTHVEFTVPEDSQVTVSLPVISNPRRIPPDYFQQLKAIAPLETTTASLGSLLGLTTLLLLASTATLTLLSIIAALTIQKALYTSAQENLRLLGQLGAGRKEILKMIAPTTLLLNLTLGAIAGTLVNLILQQSALKLRFTFLGYALLLNQNLTLAFALGLALASWLLSTFRTGPWTREET